MNIRPKEIETTFTGSNSKQAISLSFESPLIMGIVNLTPDSFYDGGRYISQKAAIEHSEQLISDGADIIDLGAASTRPGAADVSPEEELTRLLPVLEHLTKYHSKIPISIDTFHASVAKKTIDSGASIINDISGGNDPEMYKTVGKYKVPYVLMHIQGTPKTMQQAPHYTNVVEEVFQYFSDRIPKLKSAGLEQIIIDPGFGFGKTVEHNYSLLRHLDRFKSLGYPIMVGLSRKSLINKVLKTKPENALTGTISLNTIALLQGANIIRVHDIKEAKQVIQLVAQFSSPNTPVK